MSTEQTGTTSSVVSSQPFPEQREAFERGFTRAEDQFNTPQEFFPGSTVVPFAPQTEQALQLQEQRALAGSPLLRDAQETIGATARGDFLNRENPAFQQFSDTLFNDINSRVSSQFTGSGRRGSLANQETLARTFGDTIGPLAFQNFAQERANQLNAAQIAPGLAATDFLDIGQLSAVGSARQGQAGAELQDQINRFNFQQGEPRNRLSEFFRLIGGGSAGQTRTATQPVFSNPTANALSAALGIGSLGTTVLGEQGFDVLGDIGSGIGDLFGGGGGNPGNLAFDLGLDQVGNLGQNILGF